MNKADQGDAQRNVAPPASDSNPTQSEILAARLRRLATEKDNLPYPDMKIDDWLRTLYSSYLQRFLSDNNRIWTTATLMVPLSLVAFAGVNTLKPVTGPGLLVLAIPSIVLITLWLFIADKHRTFQERSEDVLNAIEEVIGFKDLRGRRPRWGIVRLSRWALTVCVWVGWGLLGLAYNAGQLVEKC